MTNELKDIENHISDTSKDCLTLYYEFGQRERQYVEELEYLKRENVEKRMQLHGMVNNTLQQTEVFAKQSELQTEDLANKFRMQ